MSRQPCLGITRMSDPGSGLGFQAPQELPPLRDNPALSPIAHTPVRELDFLCDPLRSDLKTPGGQHLALRTPNVRASAGRLSQLDMRSESANSAADDRMAANEVEHLKRQVSRLTQLRRDRDNYIQDLLSEAEATQRRHEGEIARRTVRSQREASERLSAQQQEHELHLEDRSRAHAAALAQQAWQHEREIEELRKSLRIDGERRLSERLTESANHYRDMLRRLQHGIDDLRQRLASHNAAVGDAVLGDGGLIVKTKDPDASTPPAATPSRASSRQVAQRSAQQFSSSSATAVEPEPEEAVSEALVLAPRDAAEEELFADRSANETYESVEWAMTLARKDLECALKAGWLVSEHAASEHESKLKETTQFEQKLKDATSKFEGEKRKLCRKTKDFAASAAAASSQTLLLKVLLVWGNEVRRLRSLVAEQQRVVHKRVQRQPLILTRIRADVDSWLHIVFRTWTTTSSNSRREMVDKQALKQRDEQIATEKAQLRSSVVSAALARSRCLQQLALHAWAAERRSSRSEASHQGALEKVSAAAATDLAALRGEFERDTLNLRLKRLSQGIQFINTDTAHVQRASLRAWAAVSQAARTVRVVEEQLISQRKELGESHQTQGYLVAQAAVEHTRLLAFHAWAGARMVAKCEADAAHRLEAAAIEAAEAKAEVVLEAQGLGARLSGQLHTQGLRLGLCHRVFAKRLMLLRWSIATRDARKEAAHRRQLITAAADASAEVYKLRGEGKKVAVELRKQRRAHGVAAIHANLDRRLQSVLLAWGGVVRDSQREAAYQRQLDIAAAESAAGCAVLRMEGRRTSLELREERRTQALRAIEAGLAHWQHLILREWRAHTLSVQQQAQFERAVAEERRQGITRMLAVEAHHRTELHHQAADCEARISSSLASSGAEADLHHDADLRAREASAEQVTRLLEEREGLQAQIATLHDELRRLHGNS